LTAPDRYRRIRFNQHSDYAALAELVNQGYEVEDDLFAPNTAVVTIPTKDTLVQAVVDRFGRDGEEIVESADDLTLTELLAFQALPDVVGRQRRELHGQRRPGRLPGH
jgi:ribonucleoside-triphosphate reductase